MESTDTKTTPLVSIIIPVYNAEKYIDRCLQSVINQAYSNIEIIVINDGTKDSSADIAKKYALDDPRMKVYDYSNGGLSVARNRGLAIAKGDYVIFLDSDDWLEWSTVKNSVDRIIQDDADVVVFDFYHATPRGKIEFRHNAEAMNNRDGIINELLWDRAPSYAWNKLYKRQLWNDVLFPENTNFEDLAVMIDIMNKTRNISYLPKCLYNYSYDNSNSITNMVSAKNKYGRFIGWEKREKYAQACGNKELYTHAREWAIRAAVVAYGLHLAQPCLNDEQVRKIKKYCSDEQRLGPIEGLNSKYRLLLWGVLHCNAICYLYGAGELALLNLDRLRHNL